MAELRTREEFVSDCRVYHTHEKITESILLSVAEVPGVVTTNCNHPFYCVTVLKSPAWQWREIDQKIVTLLGCLDLRVIESGSR